ncbi:hypothetical protein STCU_00936 [Strigomonas culicis]|uniref:Uncharacterized protein n=1 Tax=Strigomonas culicis TaxID=28005 RepID=S9V3W5_9TRYP|nr:hypothetical protein STCU_03026 [Strigomonas culicis]EPY35739.1 hypothetical protein STCU_00936 [Strigomonas culicis]|eukprot:EPY32002.1 hypothetical protein STCU_03026 [Strigomonas culicis]
MGYIHEPPLASLRFSHDSPSLCSTLFRLVLLDLLLVALGGLGADLLVVLLERGEVLAGLGELALLHTLADVPVHEGALAVHEVELVVDAGEHLGDRGRVGNHAHGALHLGEVAAGHDGGGLVVDAALEAGGRPVDELDGALGLDGRDGGVDVLGDDITAVHEAARHVLAVAGVALGQHASGLEDGVGDLRHGQLLVVRLLRGDDGRVAGQHEVDARVGHQVGLELGQIHVERAVEAEGRREGRHDLADEAVHVGVRGALNVQGAAGEVVDGLVVEHRGHIGVLQEGVGGQHGVVGLHDGRGHLGRGVHGVAELGLLAVVHGQALEQEGAEARARATADGVEDHEALKARAVVRQLADAVEAQVHDLLTNGVVAARVVVRRILLAGDELLGVEQLAVGAGADLIDHGGLQVQEDRAGNVLASTRLREEGVERIILDANRLVRRHRAIGLNAVLKTKQLPRRVTNLATSLADVNADRFAHREVACERGKS